MVGQTLREIRTRIDELAVDRGPYCVVCGRTGERFVPIDGLRFPDRATAAEAALLAERYRAALRRYDPQLPCHDPVACETPVYARAPEPWTGDARNASEVPFRAVEPPASGLIEYCHDVAAAVFEQLTERGHRGVESAVMDAYFDRAETTTDRDRLCVELLRSAAFELDARLSTSEQARVLFAAAERLPEAPGGDDPLEATLAHLRSKAVLDSYDVVPTDRGASPSSWSVTLTDYVFGAESARVPTLPIAVDLLRRHPGPPAVASASSSRRGEWTLELTLSSDSVPRGLATVTASRP